MVISEIITAAIVIFIAWSASLEKCRWLMYINARIFFGVLVIF